MDERMDREAGAENSRDQFRDSADQAGREDEDGVLTLVCLKCGTEYYFGEEQPSPDLVCEKCGNTVFRSFFAHEAEDEAETDFRDVTERDLHTDDPEGAAMPGDILDLDPERR